jgi:hypothetical protein
MQCHSYMVLQPPEGTVTLHATWHIMSLKGYEQLLTNRKSQWYPQPEGFAVDV